LLLPFMASDSDDDDDNDDADGQCPICLEPLYDASLLDRCFHRFCFDCALAWLSVTPSCPLCKQATVAVIHRIVSPHDYERVLLADALRLERSRASLPSKRRRVEDQTPPRRSLPPPASVPNPAAIRRQVYERRLTVLPLQFDATEQRATVADALERANRLDATAQTIAKQWNRVAPFAERDLRVLTGVQDVSLLMRAIQALLAVHNVRRSDDAQKYAAQFLTRPQADQFFVELVAFGACVFSIATYDRVVRYDPAVAFQEPPAAAAPPPSLPTSSAAAAASSGSSVYCSCGDESVDVCEACREVAFLQRKVAEVDAELAENHARLQALEQTKAQRQRQRDNDDK